MFSVEALQSQQICACLEIYKKKNKDLSISDQTDYK